MRVETIAEARALVGRTFERDGVLRRVASASPRFMSHGFLVHFREKRADRVYPGVEHYDDYNDWLSGATEVTEVHDA